MLFFLKDCYQMNHIPIFILCGLFPHYSWTGLMTCLVQEKVTEFLGLGIRSRVASAFTVSLSSEATEPGLAALRMRGHVEKEAEGAWAGRRSHSNQPIWGDRQARKTNDGSSSLSTCQLAANMSERPALTTTPHGQRKSLQPRPQNHEQMSGYCWFKSLRFRCGL